MPTTDAWTTARAAAPAAAAPQGLTHSGRDSSSKLSSSSSGMIGTKKTETPTFSKGEEGHRVYGGEPSIRTLQDCRRQDYSLSCFYGNQAHNPVQLLPGPLGLTRQLRCKSSNSKGIGNKTYLAYCTGSGVT